MILHCPLTVKKDYSSRLSVAKDRLRIQQLWLHYDLHGPVPVRDGCYCSPFREDRNPSFSIFDNGRRFKDFGTNEYGDAVDFLSMATGLTGRPLFDLFMRLAGNSAHEFHTPTKPAKPTKPPTFAIFGGRRPLRLQLRIPTLAEIFRIAGCRQLSPEGLALAAKKGFLRMGTVKGHNAWIVRDIDARTASARRSDGLPFVSNDGREHKSDALTKKDWPLGIGALPVDPDPKGAILLCEGEPDFLAAFHFMVLWGEPRLYPVTVLGRTVQLHPEAAERLEGWNIRAFPHADADGKGFAAMSRWAEGIRHARATAFDFQGLRRSDGAPVKDLNDAALIVPGSEPHLHEMNPLPPRHPCNDPERLAFDQANLFRLAHWGEITAVSEDGAPIIGGAVCPF